MPFNENVFVNCPFDKDYKPLLDPLLFTLLSFGLEPQISETDDSGTIRINRIKQLILRSKYSVHDLSRCEALKKGQLPRFNMPFEFGLDMGCKGFSASRTIKRKKNLILETEPYRYQKVLSDIAGQDIRYHDNDPQELVIQVRSWFSSVLKKNIISGSRIWSRYNEFVFDLEKLLRNEGFLKRERDQLPKSNIIRYMKAWLKGK